MLKWRIVKGITLGLHDKIFKLKKDEIIETSEIDNYRNMRAIIQGVEVTITYVTLDRIAIKEL